MAKIKQPYQCDNCGQLREKDTNCWWLLMVQREKDRADGRRFFHGSAWEENAAAVEGIRHAWKVCMTEGQALDKIIEEYLDAKAVEENAAEEVEGLRKKIIDLVEKRGAVPARAVKT